ncbi:sirohydrochlorin ferrochelatase [Anaerosolibacter carboniphilus]|uniref:Sirohydrochlorin ferrochelatase n=1 Tax=Anaerosolibacter carboniphilus TaxID=1417629 RepID=A0A841KTT2_9FIRM|nr:CbiX/SirB N-terminal domain-containing protein [Anaerosolibacter carboniphilus]MBB6216793.1 sirohydrochlorin ferrochelatase [Anaerosolibacter carboniphilus]
MKRALFILGHGSQAEEAAEIFSNIVEMVMNITSFETIGMGSLQLSKPSFEEGIEDLIMQDVEEIIIVPLFIFKGNHVQYDIPEALESLKKKYPTVNFIMAKHIGADHKIAAIIEERALAAMKVSY